MVLKQYSQNKPRQQYRRQQDNPAKQASYEPNGEQTHVAFRSCRLSLLSLLILGSLFLLPQASHAGQWVVTFTTAQNAPFHPVITNNSCGFGLPGDGTISLSVTPTLTWTPSGPGDTSLPPSTIQVLETANANSSHYITMTPQGTISASRQPDLKMWMGDWTWEKTRLWQILASPTKSKTSSQRLNISPQRRLFR